MDAPEVMTTAEALAYLLDECPDSLTPYTDYLYGAIRGYTIDRTECGDYVGGLAYKANCRVLVDEIPMVNTLELAYGATCAVIWFDDNPGGDPFYWERSDVESLAEMLRSMDGYPVLDEGVWSELEVEAADEAYDRARSDIIYALDRILEDDEAWEDGTEPNSDALLEWAEEQRDEWWGARDDATSHEHGQTYIDDDALAETVLAWARNPGPDDPPPPLYRLAFWADQTHPDYDSADAFGRRVAFSNCQARDARQKAEG